MSLLDTLAQSRTLWLAFVATVLITVAFPLAAGLWGLSFVDALSDPAEVRQAIAAMTSKQRVAHAWLTATLDVAYPLAYGALFIGSAVAFLPRFGRFLALAFVVLVATDLLEGVVQVLALTETADLVSSKALLTPLKTVLFLVGLLTTIAGWIIWGARRVRSG
ncbi:MAG: hypothetical protein AAF993_17925 [Pseudomonadota bacterium]